MAHHNQKRNVLFTSEQTDPATHGSTVSTWTEGSTKKDVLGVVSRWWDSYGSHLYDFDTLHIKILSYKKTN